jgi:transcriptional regulator with XRE-family HTH domain
MGYARRQRPKHLARKLLLIRQNLDISQTEMAKRLRLKTAYTAISGFERGIREPPLTIILAYARLVGISTDILIDDKLKLPWQNRS